MPDHPKFERRQALRLLGGAGIGAVLLGACGESGSSNDQSSTTPSSAGTTTPTSSSSSGGEGIVEETAGPFPADGSNGPNVLAEDGIVRRDITTSFGNFSGAATGVPLALDLTVLDARSGDPLPGAAFSVWHCTADGAYSLYSDGVTDQNYLRGIQAADERGNLQFRTIFPGAYPGRWPHVHFEIFRDLASATSAGSRLVTSQLAFPEEICQEVYASMDEYAQSVVTFPQTPLAADIAFSDGVDSQMATISGGLTTGLAATLTVRV